MCQKQEKPFTNVYKCLIVQAEVKYLYKLTAEIL